MDTVMKRERDSEFEVLDAKRCKTTTHQASRMEVNAVGLEVVSQPSFFNEKPLAIVEEPSPLPVPTASSSQAIVPQSCRQFWKAGDHFEGSLTTHSSSLVSAAIDRARVHPKFLHSNATSHKWALGAFAELLDNSVDEVCNGATYVNIDMLKNQKDETPMLLIEDNGGGMGPDGLRQCMSLGYSVKSRLANTIGKYGNGFKTSTMRLGADVIVFSRCRGKDGKSPTQSVGLLSYTFLRSTGKEDIVVPMVDYKKEGHSWNLLIRSSSMDHRKILETIVDWSPFLNEDNLLQQFNSMQDQGTRIIIYNLWEDDGGWLELDFNNDKHDIQLRSVSPDGEGMKMAGETDQKKKMVDQFPHLKHIFTYIYSLRSYASILYLRLPPGFKIVLRGKDVEHHNLVDDMIYTKEFFYRPKLDGEEISKELLANGTLGFVKDGSHHIDIQGFNVYHNNRLIKPFWRVWNAAGSGGRGVIGVLEANYVEPAHDKQGFERTIALQRLESRLKEIQKEYWFKHSHKVGYVYRTPKKASSFDSPLKDNVKVLPQPSHLLESSENASNHHYQFHYKHSSNMESGVTSTSSPSYVGLGSACYNHHTPYPTYAVAGLNTSTPHFHHQPASFPHNVGLAGVIAFSKNLHHNHNPPHIAPIATRNERSRSMPGNVPGSSSSTVKRENKTEKGFLHEAPEREYPKECDTERLKQLHAENRELSDRLKQLEEAARDLQYEGDRQKALEARVSELERKVEEVDKQQEAMIDEFSEERVRRDAEEMSMRDRLRDARTTINDLQKKLSGPKLPGPQV